MGDLVWIRNVDGSWHSGKVSGQTTRVGQTRRVSYSIDYRLPTLFNHSFIFTERRIILPCCILLQYAEILCAAKRRDQAGHCPHTPTVNGCGMAVNIIVIV
jgi:hypothetical protein